MTQPAREAVYGALFALLDGAIPGVATFSRRMALPSDVPAAKQPALFLGSSRSRRSGRGAVRRRSAPGTPGS